VRRGTRISEARAIEIARQAIQGKVDLQSPGAVTVKRERGRYVVIFEHYNPPGVRGPDYDAKVTIDAMTGDVIELLGGS
jgi:uncharacterized membrane protein YkoI